MEPPHDLPPHPLHLPPLPYPVGLGPCAHGVAVVRALEKDLPRGWDMRSPKLRLKHFRLAEAERKRQAVEREAAKRLEVEAKLERLRLAQRNPPLSATDRALLDKIGSPVVRQVLLRVSRATHLSVAELLSKRRLTKHALARHAVFYWSCRLTRLSLPQIGAMLDRDHSSIIHGRNIYPKKRAAMGRHLREVA